MQRRALKTTHRTGSIGLGTLIFLVASCVTNDPPPSPPVPSTYSPELLADVLARENFYLGSSWDGVYVRRAATELGDEALPPLVEALSSPYENARRNAATALAYVGGPKAVEELRECYAKTGDPGVLAELCFALGSTGTPTERQYLVDTMERYLERGGTQEVGWNRLFDAVLFALGVLREQQAKPVLEELVRRARPESFVANMVLRWLKHGYFAVPVLENPTERDEVILAVLRNGLENTLDDQTAHLHEADSDRSWIRSPERWDVSYADDNAERMPVVRFDVFISSDGQRALCMVSQVFGPLAGSGHDFVLRRESDAWRVVGVRMTWIS